MASSTDDVPRVATMLLSPILLTSRLLTIPTTAPNAITITTVSTTFMWKLVVRMAARMEPVPAACAKARSKAPAAMAHTRPTDRIPVIDCAVTIFFRVETRRNVSGSHRAKIRMNRPRM